MFNSDTDVLGERYVRFMSSQIRPSLCVFVVCNVAAYSQRVEIFGSILSPPIASGLEQFFKIVFFKKIGKNSK